MTVVQGIVLGIVQGLAEFLPISSSGHLLLIRNFFNLSDTTGSYLIFDILLHVGTLIVVLTVFWKDWLDILKNPFKSKTLLLLFIASLPALFAVVFGGDVIDALETGSLLGLSFILTGVLLSISQIIVDKNKSKNTLKNKPGFLQAISMGITQILGLLPGVSRSGSSMFGGLITGLDKKSAAKFSFMMSAPAIVGSLLYEGKNAIKNGYLSQIELLPTICGMLAAAICGYIAIKFMLKLISKISLHWFSLYVVILGIIVIIFQISGTLNLPPMPLAVV